MLNCLAVGIGGFIGSVLRYLAGLIPLGSSDGFPIKTLIINVIGAFAIAAFSSLALKGSINDPRLALLLKTGLCGGFTTFSTFAVEVSGLIERNSITYAVLYVFFSIVLGLLAVYLGNTIFGK